jgi:hypothetical protein
LPIGVVVSIDCVSSRRLLVEVKIDVGSLKLLDRVEQVNERTAEPINRPGHHNIEFASLGITEHQVKARTAIAAFAAG